MNNIKLNKPYRKGVNTIILDKDNNFLLIQKNAYKDNEWNFLGGGHEEGETLNKNIFRELEEEIGSKKDDFEIISTSIYKIKYDYPLDIALKINDGKYRGQFYDQVILKFIGDKNKLVFTTKEFKKHKWVKGKELKKHLTFSNQYKKYKEIINETLPDLIV